MSLHGSAFCQMSLFPFFLSTSEKSMNSSADPFPQRILGLLL
jgi:hypothetical protein